MKNYYIIELEKAKLVKGLCEQFLGYANIPEELQRVLEMKWNDAVENIKYFLKILETEA